MVIQRSKRKFAFRNYNGVDPTYEELRSEVEDLYKFIDEDITSLVKELNTKITTLENRVTALE